MNLPAEFFPLPPRVEWLAPRKGIFRAPFAFISPTLGRIEIETGFDTDYASVPRSLWWLYPPDGPYSPAAWIHDWLYWYQAIPIWDLDTCRLIEWRPIEREQADLVFLEGMKVLPDVRPSQRNVMWAGVRAGGWKAWGNNRRARIEEAKDRVVPIALRECGCPSGGFKTCERCDSPTHIKQHFHKLRR